MAQLKDTVIQGDARVTGTLYAQDGTTTIPGLLSTTDKVKLDGIASGAEVNQNAFSNITIGSTTIQADTKTDTLIFVAGDNVTLTPDATNDTITITATDTTYTPASATPLVDGTAAVGTSVKYAREDHVHPTDTSRASASDLTTHTSNSTIHITSSERTAWDGKYTKPSGGIPKTDLASAVQTSLGLANTAVQDSSYVHTDNNFTSTLKSKLDGIAAGAEVNVQADWSTTDSASDAFIKNKPNLTTLAETAELSDAIPSTNYQTVSQAEKDSWNAKSNFSGNYSDLNGKPTIPTTLAQLASDTTHRVVTDAQINQWNSNYTLPSSGIPLNDLSQPVRDLLTNKTSLFESDIIIGDVYFKRYAAGRLMVSEVE